MRVKGLYICIVRFVLERVGQSLHFIGDVLDPLPAYVCMYYIPVL